MLIAQDWSCSHCLALSCHWETLSSWASKSNFLFLFVDGVFYHCWLASRIFKIWFNFLSFFRFFSSLLKFWLFPRSHLFERCKRHYIELEWCLDSRQVFQDKFLAWWLIYCAVWEVKHLQYIATQGWHFFAMSWLPHTRSHGCVHGRSLVLLSFITDIQTIGISPHFKANR